jgi:hypothetical protein
VASNDLRMPGKPVRVEMTARGFRQTSESAMGNDILMGLIELITNSDDAYGDAAGPILVRFPKPDLDQTWQAQVADRGPGIAFGQVAEKLLRLGGRTSGFELGQTKRGNRGRGAKDVCHYGRARWDTIHDDKYTWLELDRHGQGEMAEKALPAEPYRSALGLGRSGTVVTITCDRNRFRRTLRDRIRHRLELAVQLRDVMSNPNRTIKLAYGEDPVINLRYTAPAGLREFPTVEVEVKGYPGVAQIMVAEVPTPFVDDPADDPCRQGGLLIKSGRAVHEATLYRFDANPYAGYFLGWVRWDTIDVLSREFDDREEGRQEIEPSNPAQIIRPDRRGLNYQHPAARALKEAVESVLQPHFHRKAQELGGTSSESSETRRRLSGLARVIARYQARKAEELELETDRTKMGQVELTPEVPSLEVIPPRKLLEFGQAHTFSVRARTDALPDLATPEATLTVVCEPDDCLVVSANHIKLEPDRHLQGRVSATFTVTAGPSPGTAAIEVGIQGVGKALIEIEVIEPLILEAPLAPLTFEFERTQYRVGVAKRKRVLLLAPTAAVARHGNRVLLNNSDAKGLLIRHMECDLEPSPDGDWYQASIEVEGRQHGAKSMVTAHCGAGPLRAQTEIAVGRDQVSGQQPPHIVIAAIGSYIRGAWDADEEGVTITVNATHPAVRRYFGPSPLFPGQDSNEARLMVAEIVADLAVRDLLTKQLRDQEVGAEQLYRLRFQMLSELLPLCHAAQLGDAEVSQVSAKPSRARRTAAVPKSEMAMALITTSP